jgi:biotin transporter BioY
VTGWLVEQGAQRAWQRWLAGIVGVAIIYVFGVPVLKATTGMSWAEAWTAGAGIFVLVDLAKSALAASLSESGRMWLTRRSGRQ